MAPIPGDLPRSSDGSPLRVTVLRGGPGSEREVSLVSGGAVAASCRQLGLQVHEADIGPDDLLALDVPADVIFPVLHGEFGEDGALQAILESRGLLYVGCDAATSRLAIDKFACKQRWTAAGLPTAPAVLVRAETLEAALAGWEGPAVIKPNDQGSSVGVHLVEGGAELADCLRAAVGRWGVVMLERRLRGPELTVGILDRTILPVIEVRVTHGFYDYEAKYTREDTTYSFEPSATAAELDLIRAGSLAAFDALGGRHFARVDWILDQQTGPQLLEINTIPGFTSHSLLPKAAAKAGIDFDELVARLLLLALATPRRPV